ncbi:MAG: ACT domain-containing protein [Lentisphaerae bacterium]|jgi:hypothetical protein|nr:ACT domain-containing protein [Lentisphaerota bacterium]MBT4821425.1 ACT domain-containing protein [Lentisphaerota bacterium]MBT5612614.1 ACT domain-containing protein [Lentisphaerota bacterium]MBT7059273.1 ACT domain-containing protein [Lentisphaerota bacterium]MBT7845796.1 ACT domain-containing protein [Lentisphaerota bacterium]
MITKQLSIFLENRAGRLGTVTKALGEAGVNILALSLADTSDFGILRLIVNDVAKAEGVLKKCNFVCMVNDVTAVEVEDKPGGLARILNLLVDKGVNVEYMYAFSEAETGRAALIFRFDDPGSAVEHLNEAGINVFADVGLG